MVKTIKDTEPSEDSINEVLELIKSTNAIDRSRSTAESYIDVALGTISVFEGNESHRALEDLARYTVGRSF